MSKLLITALSAVSIVAGASFASANAPHASEAGSSEAKQVAPQTNPAGTARQGQQERRQGGASNLAEANEGANAPASNLAETEDAQQAKKGKKGAQNYSGSTTAPAGNSKEQHSH